MTRGLNFLQGGHNEVTMTYECFPLCLPREGVLNLCFPRPQFMTIEMLLHAGN